VFRLKGAEWVERSEKLEHDPEKPAPDLIQGGYPVFGKRSCFTNKLERDDDSNKVIAL
jgi:hypothetical protein